jgi:hypothetical protein
MYIDTYTWFGGDVHPLIPAVLQERATASDLAMAAEQIPKGHAAMPRHVFQNPVSIRFGRLRGLAKPGFGPAS